MCLNVTENPLSSSFTSEPFIGTLPVSLTCMSRCHIQAFWLFRKAKRPCEWRAVCGRRKTQHAQASSFSLCGSAGAIRLCFLTAFHQDSLSCTLQPAPCFSLSLPQACSRRILQLYFSIRIRLLNPWLFPVKRSVLRDLRLKIDHRLQLTGKPHSFVYHQDDSVSFFNSVW